MNKKQQNMIKQVLIFVAALLVVFATFFGVSKFVISDKSNSVQLQFNTYKIEDNEITISPEADVYTGGGVTVTIAPSILTTVNAHRAEADKMKIEYQYISSGSEGTPDDTWNIYTEPFTIERNGTINARLVSEKDFFVGPTTTLVVSNIAVAKIVENENETTYKTLAEAIAACPMDAGETQTTITMLADTQESVTILEGANIKIDLNGKNFTSEGTAITNNGTLEIAGTGTIQSTTAVTAIVNNSSATIKGGTISSAGTAVSVANGASVTLGDNGDASVANATSPTIIGATGGITVADGGTLNFYDGIIKVPTNKTAVQGNIASTPEGYRLITNESDTEVIGETTYKKAYLDNHYTVTYNYDGATGGNSTASKTVTYDAAYGELPTPSREGYTFEGWNGKNLFDEESILMAIPEATHNDGYYIFNPRKAQSLYGSISGEYVGTENLNLGFKDDTQYTLSLKGYSDYIESVKDYQTIFLGFFYTDNTYSRTYLNNGTETVKTITSEKGKSIDKVVFSYGRHDGDVHIAYIQVEEGTNATAYEPYYVTDTTPVTQAQDHTLTAIWTPNPLTFEDQTQTFEYSASAQNFNITPATNGTGTYTYTEVSEKNASGTDTSYISIDGAQVTVAANTPVGTYTYVIRATDSNSGATKEATYTILVNYQQTRFATGPTVNEKMKKLAGNATATHETEDTNITKIERKPSLPQDFTATADNTVSDSNSLYPIYMWYDSTQSAIYWYTEDTGTVYYGEDTSYFYSNLKGLTAINVSAINSSYSTDMSYLFHNCLALTSLDVSSLDTSGVTSMKYMFGGDETRLKYQQNYKMNLTSITGLRLFNTSNVTDMSYMFARCTELTTLDVSSFDTRNVTDMSYMFSGSWGTEQVRMNLTSINGIQNFNTDKVQYINNMFMCCASLTTLDVSNFNTCNVVNMNGMFADCAGLTELNISQFDTSKVTNMRLMFRNCNSLTYLDLSSFDTSNVTNMENMFRDCSNLKSIYVSDNFTTNNVTNSAGMFTNSTQLVGGSGTTYDANNVDKTYARIDGGPTSATPGYFTRKTNINVTSPLAGTYSAGEIITIVASYDKNVYGTNAKGAVTAGNAPTLALTFGSGAEKNATFSSSSGKTITYTYTIKSEDEGVLAVSAFTGPAYDEDGNVQTLADTSIGGYIMAESVFSNKSKTLTYSTTAQSFSIAPPSAGAGAFTYVEKSEQSGGSNTDYITITSAGEISVSASTPAGTYTYVVTVTETSESTPRDVTCTITINKAQVAIPESPTAKVYNGSAQDSGIATPGNTEVVATPELVVNGDGSYGDNTNFTYWEYDGSEKNGVATGSFKRSACGWLITENEYFALSTEEATYTLGYDARSTNGTAKYYSMIVPYDIDKKIIESRNYMFISGSTTTLAQDLNPEDTVVYFTNLSGWNTSLTATSQRGFIFWNYTNSQGFTYPAETYSRNFYNDMYEDASSINVTAGTITLSNAGGWQGPKIPAGTPVSQHNQAATYKYIGRDGQAFGTLWTRYTGSLTGTDYSAGRGYRKFPPYAVYGKVGFVWNSGNADDTGYITNVSVTGQSITSATNVGTYSIAYDLTDPANYEWADGTTTLKTVPWIINPYDITGNATINPIAAQPYTGSAITPEPTVTVSGRTLTKGEDYVITYGNNTNVGTATVYIMGKGNYSGMASVDFTITSTEPQASPQSVSSLSTPKTMSLMSANSIRRLAAVLTGSTGTSSGESSNENSISGNSSEVLENSTEGNTENGKGEEAIIDTGQQGIDTGQQSATEAGEQATDTGQQTVTDTGQQVIDTGQQTVTDTGQQSDKQENSEASALTSEEAKASQSESDGTQQEQANASNTEEAGLNGTAETKENELEGNEAAETKESELESKETAETKENELEQSETNTNLNSTAQVAKIGSTSYNTIYSAMQAVHNGEEIILLENLELEEEIIIEKSKNVILNLNGKTITSTSINTINNKGTLTIEGYGAIKNEVENGIVIYNNGTLNVNKVSIVADHDGAKAIYSDAGEVYVKESSITAVAIGTIGVYNVDKSKAIVEKSTIKVEEYASRCVYNASEFKMYGGELVISSDDSIGIYNAKSAKTCIIASVEDKKTKSTIPAQLLLEAKEIENYDLIKNTKEFKEELAEMQPSYAIYNDSNTNIDIEKATITVERIKGIGILNNSTGYIVLGNSEDELDTASPIVYAIADNTTAIVNNKVSDNKGNTGKIAFYDGRLVTSSVIKDVIDVLSDGYEILETRGDTVMYTTIKEVEKKSTSTVQTVNGTDAKNEDGKETVNSSKNVTENVVNDTKNGSSSTVQSSSSTLEQGNRTTSNQSSNEAVSTGTGEELESSGANNDKGTVNDGGKADKNSENSESQVNNAGSVTVPNKGTSGNSSIETSITNEESGNTSSVDRGAKLTNVQKNTVVSLNEKMVYIARYSEMRVSDWGNNTA